MSNAFQKLGRYLLVEEIASGGMAIIYRAKLIGVEGFEKEFAIKKILPYWSYKPEFITMLIDEAKVLVHLHHDNIVQVFELDKDRDAYFIVMEFVDGFDLKKILKTLHAANKTLPLDLICYITREISQGLTFAHTRRDADGNPLGIVHRDISPQNILLSLEGQVKVTDFGIAKIPGKTTKTQTGILKGKFSYMSPEQAMGKTIDQQTDVFALGSLIYEMVMDRKCFDGDNDFEIIEKVKHSQVELPADLHPKLAALITRALSLRQEDRYLTIEALRLDLEKFSTSLPRRADATDLKIFLESLFQNEVVAKVRHTRDITERTRALANDVTSLKRESTLETIVDPSAPTAMPVVKPMPDLSPPDHTIVSDKTVHHEKTIVEEIPAAKLFLDTSKDPVLSLQSQRGTNRVWRLVAILVPFAILTYGLIHFYFTPTKVALPPPTPMVAQPEIIPPSPPTPVEPEVPPPPPHIVLALKSIPATAHIVLKHEGKTYEGTGALQFDFDLMREKESLPVTVTLAGYHPLTQSIDVIGESPQIERTLTLHELQYGTLTVDARPWGLTTVTGYGQKETPSSFKLQEGEHVVRVTFPPKQKSLSQTIHVAPNGNVHCKASFANTQTLVCN